MDPTIDMRLMEGLNFSREDVIANRQGKFSAAQQRTWEAFRAYNQEAAARASSGTSMIALVGVFVLLLVVLTGALAATGVLSQLIDMLGALIIPAAGVAALLIALLLRSVVAAQRSSIAIVAAMGDPTQALPAVLKITGRAQTVHEVSHSRTGNADIGRRKDHYFLIAGDSRRTVKMIIGQKGMGAVEPGQDYVVYYYESSGVPTFLSAEPTEAERANR